MPRSRRRRTTAANASLLVPLRGLFLVGYYTLMRPDNNRSLDWKEITLDAATMRGTFKLHQHKNVNKASRRRRAGASAGCAAHHLLVVKMMGTPALSPSTAITST